MQYMLDIDENLIKVAQDKKLDINMICVDALIHATNKENHIKDVKEFFKSDVWINDLSGRIIKDLGKVLPVSKLIENRYGFEIPSIILMKKANQLAALKPKRERPKLKGIFKGKQPKDI